VLFQYLFVISILVLVTRLRKCFQITEIKKLPGTALKFAGTGWGWGYKLECGVGMGMIFEMLGGDGDQLCRRVMSQSRPCETLQ